MIQFRDCYFVVESLTAFHYDKVGLKFYIYINGCSSPFIFPKVKRRDQEIFITLVKRARKK